MKVSIIGTGYVGLVSGVCLAYKGHEVTCYDNNHEIVDSLNNGVPTIYETGLTQMLNKVLKEKRFIAKRISNETQLDSELVIIAVGTPSEKGEIDLVFIKQVSVLLGKYIKSNDNFVSIVVKSTVIPGTTDTFVR